MASKEWDLLELKRLMDEWFKLLKKAKTEDGKLCAIETIGRIANEMSDIAEKGVA